MTDVRTHRVLASISRVAVLETVREGAAPVAVPDLAERLGLHPNTVRRHLQLLAEHGYVARRRDASARRGRPRFVWTATPDPSPPQRRRDYRLLASILAEYLRETGASGAAVEAGARFGARWFGARWSGEQWSGEQWTGVGDEPAEGARGARPAVTLDRVVRMLDDIGFRPEVTDDGTAIRLHHCPFHELARDRQDVVCAVHLGLVRGALHQLGAPVEATRLVPFVTPQLCVVEIGPCPQERASVLPATAHPASSGPEPATAVGRGEP